MSISLSTEKVDFKPERDAAVTANLTLTNTSDHTRLFKVLTTAPKRYRVKPATGTIPPDAKSDVQLIMMPQQLDLVDAATLAAWAKDKFQIKHMRAPPADNADSDPFKSAPADTVEALRVKVTHTTPPAAAAAAEFSSPEALLPSPVLDSEKENSAGVAAHKGDGDGATGVPLRRVAPVTPRASDDAIAGTPEWLVDAADKLSRPQSRAASPFAGASPAVGAKTPFKTPWKEIPDRPVRTPPPDEVTEKAEELLKLFKTSTPAAAAVAEEAAAVGAAELSPIKRPALPSQILGAAFELLPAPARASGLKWLSVTAAVASTLAVDRTSTWMLSGGLLPSLIFVAVISYYCSWAFDELRISMAS